MTANATYTDEFWAQAGQRWFDGETLEGIARDLGLKTSTLDRQITKRGYNRETKRQYRQNMGATTTTRRRAQDANGHAAAPSQNDEVSQLKAALEAAQQQLRQSQQLWETSQARIDNLQAELKLAQTTHPSQAQEIRRLLKQSYGAMSRRFHPDMGGDNQSQTVVNLVFEDLTRRFDHF